MRVFDTRRLALVAVELAANARPLTVFKNAQFDGLSASGSAARQQKEKAAKVQNKAKYPKGAPQVPARRPRFVLLLFASRRRSTPPARRRGDAVERTPSRGTPSPRWRRRGAVLRHWHPVEHRHPWSRAPSSA